VDCALVFVLNFMGYMFLSKISQIGKNLAKISEK